MESVCGRDFDIVHSPHPLIIPTRRARRIITVHDLFFLKHPEMTSAEIRRDYAPLVRAHATRADFILCPSAFTGAEVERLLGVPKSRIGVTPLGVDPIYRQPPAIDVEALLTRLGVPCILGSATPSLETWVMIGDTRKREDVGTIPIQNPKSKIQNS